MSERIPNSIHDRPQSRSGRRRERRAARKHGFGDLHQYRLWLMNQARHRRHRQKQNGGIR